MLKPGLRGGAEKTCRAVDTPGCESILEAILGFGLSQLWSIISGTWNALFLAAPFVLFGLVIAGVLHVLLSRRSVERWLGGPGLMAVATAACFGVPLPICSCGVVPVSIELKRKGASRPANLSFLITTPESSADAVLLTWGMFGWVMAVVRPLASFLTGLVAGILAIAFPEDDADAPAAAGEAFSEHDRIHVDESHVVGPRAFVQSLIAWVKETWRRPLRREEIVEPAIATDDPAPGEPHPFPKIVRDIVRYAFVDLADDIVFWLVFGLVLTGVISTFVPDDLAARGLGAGIAPMLVLMAVGIPLYMCAVASTPVAAALVSKGVSPGAALVFLLTGPATNAATIVLLSRHFGRRFVNIYLASIAFTAVAAGLALDAALAVTGYTIPIRLAAEPGGAIGVLQWACALFLSLLILWRFRRGALRRGLSDLRNNLEGLFGFTPDPARASESRSEFWCLRRRRFAVWAVAVVCVAYPLSGFYVVPPDSTGYGFVFGKLVSPDRPPGLHYNPPVPFGRADVWRTGYPRKTDIGFRTDLSLLANRRELMRFANPGQWHSPVAAMNTVGDETSSIAGDENLIDISMTIHYDLSDPYRFFYAVGKDSDVVSLYSQAAAREYVAVHSLEELLTTAREDMQAFIARDVQDRLDAVRAGVRVSGVHIVDIHPPQDAVFAFRDVSSAREDRETRIHEAYERLADEVPKARGEAALTLARAQSAADSARLEAKGRAEGFTAMASSYGTERVGLALELWLERSEKLLSGREKYVLPADAEQSGVVLWRDTPSVLPPEGKSP